MKKIKYNKMMKNRLLEFLREKIDEFIKMYAPEEQIYDYDLKLVLSRLISEIENKESQFDIVYLTEEELKTIPEDLLYFYSIYTFDNELLEMCVILNKIEGMETFDSCIGITYQQPGYIKMYYESEKTKEKIKRIFKHTERDIKITITESINTSPDKRKILKLEFSWINRKKISNYKKREEVALAEKLKYMEELIKRIKKEFNIRITDIDRKKFLNKLEKSREEIIKKFETK